MPKKIKKIYMDYAATTPTDPRVLKSMLSIFSEKFGNTMSLHFFGQEARDALEKSREVMANSIGAKPNEIIFTSSATESNNWALKGIAFANRKNGKHIIISSIEHPCVMESAKWLEEQGFEVTRVGVDKYGLINPKDVERAIKKETILVSLMHANNEIGTIEPIKEIGKIIRKSKIKNQQSKIYFHSDAAQTLGKIPVNVNELGVDLLTGSSHKIYGPKGAAFLYVKEGTKISRFLHGGGHEMGLRASTVNVAAIVGFAKALEIAKKEMRKESQRLEKLRKKLEKGILEKIKGSHLVGHPRKRLPNIVNFWFEGVEGESIVIELDLFGVAVSSGSACSSEKLEPSYVLLAIGLKPWQAHGSLRLSFGRWTKEKDINYLLRVLPGIIKRLRGISPI